MFGDRVDAPTINSPPEIKQPKNKGIKIQKMDEYCKEEGVFFNETDRINH